MITINVEDVGYKCNFCEEVFDSIVDCAKHLQAKSGTGKPFPSDIIMVDKRKYKLNDKSDKSGD